MRKHSLKVLIGVSAALLMLVVGAAAGGGVVYALTQIQAGVSSAVSVEQIAPEERGIVIASVVSDGPAAQAGVKRGDILLKINDQNTDSFAELMSYLGSLSAGSEANVTVLHGDDERTLTVTLGDRNGQPYLGLVPCGGVHQAIAIERTIPGVTGVTIVDVASNGPADQAGLQQGDTIIAVNGQEVDIEHTLPDLIAAQQPGDTVTLTVKSPDEEARAVTVELNEHPNKAGAAHLGVRFRPFRHVDVFRGGRFGAGGPHMFKDRLCPFPGGKIEGGAFIIGVAEDSPAAAAGLNEGEVITALDGEPIKSPGDLIDAVAERQPGDTVTLTVAGPEEDATREVTVTLAENPDEAGKAYLGVQLGGFYQKLRSEEGLDLD